MDKALVVAISSYGGLDASPLPGAANALTAWTNLLVDHYKFFATTGGNLHRLADEDATKDNILAELKWLAAGATANDRLIAIFIGHGSHLNRLDPEFLIVTDEQCLITYPRPFDNLEDVALFGDQIITAIGTTAARVLLVVDSCHSRGVFDGELQPLYVEAAGDGVFDGVLEPLFIEAAASRRLDVAEGLRGVTFKQRLTSPPGTLAPGMLAREAMISRASVSAAQELRSAGEMTSIVVMSAAQELESAYEGEIGGKRQMLFSYHAIDALNVNDGYQYQDLRSAIAPKLSPHQTPDVDGDASRTSNPFTY